MSECRHEQFDASVRVNRITDSGALAAFVADVQIVCAQCHQHFVFVGSPVGLSCDQPHVSADGQTLHAPLAPSFTWQSEVDLPVRGFTMRRSGEDKSNG